MSRANTFAIEYPIPRPSSKFSQEFANAGVYQEFRCDTRWETDYGRCVLPVAGEYTEPDGKGRGNDLPPEICDVHKPFTRKIVDWTLEFIGDPSGFTLPLIDTGDTDDTIIFSSVTGVTPPIIGQQVWRVSGTYIYACNKPLRPGGTFPLGKSPVDMTTAKENQVPARVWSPILGTGKTSNNFRNNSPTARGGGGSQNE